MFNLLFSKYLEEEEASIENLEQKLERTLKLCTVMIDSGKEYVKNQRYVKKEKIIISIICRQNVIIP